MARLWSLVDRRALAATALCLVAWRLLGQIPISNVTSAFITTRLDNLSGLGLFPAIGPNSIPLASYSVGEIGIAPYVEALIVMSLLTLISSRVRDMARNAEGRVTLTRWARALALLLTLGQAYGLTVLYQNTIPPVFGPLDWFTRLAVCLELAGGTALMILLADAMDEFGLGFGNGALIFYALGPLGTEVHRIAGYFATSPSAEALYRPLALWAAFTVGVTIAGVAVLLAVRRVSAPTTKKVASRPTALRLLMSGVLRPPQFTFAIMFLPTIVANYYASTNSSGIEWFRANWGPYGTSVWLDAAYLILEAALVVFFAVFVAAYEYRILHTPSHLRTHVTRLALIGGLFLALAVIAVPVADHLLTGAAGNVIPMSGAEVLLVVAMVLITVRLIEGHKTEAPFTRAPSGLP